MKFKKRITYCIEELLNIIYFEYTGHYYYCNLNMYSYLACHCSFKYIPSIDSSPQFCEVLSSLHITIQISERLEWYDQYHIAS